jgi:PAS domain S-box-containing protein
MAANSLRHVDEQLALRIFEGTAGETGESFYHALVEHLARALDARGAWVTEYLEERRRLRALAFWLGGESLKDVEYDIAGTACERVVDDAQLVCIPDGFLDGFKSPAPPPPPALGTIVHHMQRHGVVSYLGVPLLGEGRRVLGHLGVVDTRPMPPDPRVLSLFRLFASRALAEMRRLRLEAELRERENKLARLVGSAMDAIIELDAELRITLMNAAAEKVFGCTAERLRGDRFGRLLTREALAKLEALARRVGESNLNEPFLWIAGGLMARRLDGSEFPAEATLSCFEVGRKRFYTLILRNVRDRIEAERRIDRLTAHTEYLRETIRSEGHFGDIIGASPQVLAVLQQIRQVAGTDASVLITGETGTGKELFARAIHDGSRRRDKPLITVNCAAVPATLIESEFFGHERGAFTGATQRRVGRFELSDGGTIFLDEIGDLPLDLQGKLLRVLQQGEFEPVGSSRTRKVDVRVLAATNRDLERAIRDGTFREDLYYRLNVFPLRLPPLRERGDDVVRIASVFVSTLAPRMGKTIEPLSDEDRSRLMAYAWPGNVRELRNVIERALIVAVDGRIRLEGMLPDPMGAREAPARPRPRDPAASVLTVDGLKELERRNLIEALERTGWRIAGADGAARLLGTNPSTLRSRIAALGIARATRGD